MAVPIQFYLFDEGGVGKALAVSAETENCDVAKMNNIQTSAYTASIYYNIFRTTASSTGCYSFLGGSDSFSAAVAGENIIDCQTLALNVRYYNETTNCTGFSFYNQFSSCTVGLCATQPLNPIQQSLLYVNTFTDFLDNDTKKQFLWTSGVNDSCPIVPVLDVFDTTATVMYMFNYQYAANNCYSNAIDSGRSIRFELDCGQTQNGSMSSFDSLDCSSNLSLALSSGCRPLVNDTTIVNGLCLAASSENSISVPMIIGIAIGSTVFLSLLIWALRWCSKVYPRSRLV